MVLSNLPALHFYEITWRSVQPEQPCNPALRTYAHTHVRTYMRDSGQFAQLLPGSQTLLLVCFSLSLSLQFHSTMRSNFEWNEMRVQREFYNSLFKLYIDNMLVAVSYYSIKNSNYLQGVNKLKYAREYFMLFFFRVSFFWTYAWLALLPFFSNKFDFKEITVPVIGVAFLLPRKLSILLLPLSLALCLISMHVRVFIARSFKWRTLSAIKAYEADRPQTSRQIQSERRTDRQIVQTNGPADRQTDNRAIIHSISHPLYFTQKTMFGNCLTNNVPSD